MLKLDAIAEHIDADNYRRQLAALRIAAAEAQASYMNAIAEAVAVLTTAQESKPEHARWKKERITAELAEITGYTTRTIYNITSLVKDPSAAFKKEIQQARSVKLHGGNARGTNNQPAAEQAPRAGREARK